MADRPGVQCTALRRSGQDDETSDIRIAASGMDFHIDAHAAGQSTITPSFSVYVCPARLGGAGR